MSIIFWYLCSSCGFCPPRTILHTQLCSAGMLLPAPAELLGVNIPGTETLGHPSVPLFPGLLGPASAVKHHFYWIAKTLSAFNWVNPYCRWMAQTVPCPSAKLSEKKTLAGISSIAHKLLLSHFPFHFFLAPWRCRSQPGPRAAALWVCLVNLGADELVLG